MTQERIEELITQASEANKNAAYAMAEQYCREALSLVQPNPEHKTKILLILTESLRRRGHIQEALPIAGEAFMLASQTGNSSHIAKSLSYLGNLHYYLSAYTETINYYLQALQAFEQLGSENEAAVVMSNVAVVYTEISENKKALEYYFKALPILKRVQNDEAAANAVGNIGNVYMNMADYPLALEHYMQAYSMHSQAGRKAEASIFLGNIANVYTSVSDYKKALEYFAQALAIHEEMHDLSSIARVVGNMGIVYLELGLNDKAVDFYNRALVLHKEIGDIAGVARVLGNIGNMYQGQSIADDKKAIGYLEEALRINEEIGNPDGVADMIGSLGISYKNVGNYPQAFDHTRQAITLHQSLGARVDKAIGLSHLGVLHALPDSPEYNPAKAEELLLEAIRECETLNTTNLACGMYQHLANIYEQQHKWQECAAALRSHQKLLVELQKEEATNQTYLYENRRKLEESERDRQVKLERFQEQEKVLNNILPQEITTRLIEGQNPIADHFDSVSVLFMDIVGFTVISTKVSARQLVHLLNAIFTAADGVMREFGLEKIKTIGDAYMAVAGAPAVQTDHAERAAQAAQKLLDVMKNLVVTFPDELGDRSWIGALPEIQVRIGLHCGPVAAGVVGENKFLYDLWGDAVNTASRMESHGEAGKIHVSEEFVHQLAVGNEETTTQKTETNRILTFANCSLSIIPRGELEIKGKGLMKTFFLEKA